jgi:beta-galactosidase
MLNEAWGTAFWSQRYTDWAEVLPPRATTAIPNPAQVLDFRRFSSDALLALCTAEHEVLRQVTPDIPATTNFMAGIFDGLDYWRWARTLDLVATDHYLVGARPEPHVDLAYAADLTRSLGGGRPWLLMEHSTSAVNWQPRNYAKAPGQLLRNSLTHVARGSDGALFFQWRASRSGAEKWHSAMLPHAGTDSRVWREVVGLGAALRRLAPVASSTVDAPVALILDYPSGWAAEGPAQPSVDMGTFEEVRRCTAPCGGPASRPTSPRPAPSCPGTRRCSSPRCTSSPTPTRRTSRPMWTLVARCWSGRTAAWSTSVTRCGLAATQARSPTCSASGSRSSTRCPPTGP